MGYRVYSFDIFDTLLLRPYANPQEVWNVLEEREQVRGFAKARKKADAVTYKRAVDNDGETTIEEAYELIPHYQHLMQKEMNLEREILQANPEMIRLWNKLGQQGKRRIIVSDMYLPADFIKNVLREKGFDGWEGFYLSRDYNVRKSTGKLFEVMLKTENVKPDEVIHIGDNLDSDVNQPKALGIHVQLYQKVINRLYEECPFTKQISGRISGALALGWHQFKIEHPDFTYWHRLGFMMGGVLGYIYVKWIIETARQIGKNHLMFIARDGYIWKAICNTLYPEIRTDYFYAPRLVSIALLGATGTDPWAISDRQHYIDEHLKDIDADKIGKSYRQYLSQYVFDDKTAIIDGCSSGFSAQRLIEQSIGGKVFCFYLLAMANMHNAAALYSTHLLSLQWQMLSEFLFGAPENPIKGIVDDKPVYEEYPPKHECFKISVSQEITDGAVACAKILEMYNVEISAHDWQKYVDLFMENLSDEDREYLDKAKNAPDVEQKSHIQVVYTPNPSFKRGVKLQRYALRLTTNKNIYSLYIDRKGIHYSHKDISVLIGHIAK